MGSNEFIFTGIIFKDGIKFTALCPELDIASEGDNVAEAENNLIEAVTLYLESAIESNLPYLRPVPSEEDPRNTNPDSIVKIFNIKVDIFVKAYA